MAGVGWIGRRLEEAVDLPSSGALRLEWSEAQQRKPVRMVFAGHDFARAFAAALGTAATHEAPVVQEEPRQIQVRVAQVAAQCEVGAQSRVEVLHQRIATQCLRHGPADGLEQRVELAVHLSAKSVQSPELLKLSGWIGTYTRDLKGILGQRNKLIDLATLGNDALIFEMIERQAATQATILDIEVMNCF
jgi:hypothetical protein